MNQSKGDQINIFSNNQLMCYIVAGYSVGPINKSDEMIEVRIPGGFFIDNNPYYEKPPESRLKEKLEINTAKKTAKNKKRVQ